MPETLEKSVLSHPEVQARYHDFLSVLEGKNIQRGGLLPNVSVEAKTGHEWRTGIGQGVKVYAHDVPNAPTAALLLEYGVLLPVAEDFTLDSAELDGAFVDN